MPKNILIIDDDADLSAQMADFLRDEGHKVHVQLFTFETLPSFRPDDYDIVVLDLKMPDLSGVDILRSLKEKPFRAKIFIMSGKPFVEKLLKEENLSGMITEIMPKPFSISNLLDKINSV